MKVLESSECTLELPDFDETIMVALQENKSIRSPSLMLLRHLEDVNGLRNQLADLIRKNRTLQELSFFGGDRKFYENLNVNDLAMALETKFSLMSLGFDGSYTSVIRFVCRHYCQRNRIRQMH